MKRRVEKVLLVDTVVFIALKRRPPPHAHLPAANMGVDRMLLALRREHCEIWEGEYRLYGLESRLLGDGDAPSGGQKQRVLGHLGAGVGGKERVGGGNERSDARQCKVVQLVGLERRGGGEGVLVMWGG